MKTNAYMHAGLLMTSQYSPYNSKHLTAPSCSPISGAPAPSTSTVSTHLETVFKHSKSVHFQEVSQQQQHSLHSVQGPSTKRSRFALESAATVVGEASLFTCAGTNGYVKKAATFDDTLRPQFSLVNHPFAA